MTTPATLTWFASHELRLAWRDFVAMMTAQQRWRGRNVVIVLLVFGAFMHLIASAMGARYADAVPDKATLVALTGSALLAWSLMLSQAMESVTRAFYSRSDLDLILSSPAPVRKLFAVRLATMALGITLMAVGISAPFVNMLAFHGGPRWLAAYAVAAAMGASAAALAGAPTGPLFCLSGPRRPRRAARGGGGGGGAALGAGVE